MGATIQKTAYYPFGQVWQASATQKDARFASMDLTDSATGNNPTLFRSQNPLLFRWLSPDPLAGSIMNPQSLNRYGYVLNNPMNLIDPLGGPPRDPQDHIDHVIDRIGQMEARIANFLVRGCTLDGVSINCVALGSAIRAGLTNLEPIFSHGAIISGYYATTPIIVTIVGYLPGTDIPIIELSPSYALFTLNMPGAYVPPQRETIRRRTKEEQAACHQQAVQDFAPGLGGFVSTFSLYDIESNFPITLGSEAVKYGLPVIGEIFGVPILTIVGTDVALASGAATTVATVTDARARMVCGEEMVP